MYKVINRFKEKHHNGHVYEVGDVYPAEDKKLVASRADFLTKQHAEYGVAFLEKVEEKSDEQSVEEPAVKSSTRKSSTKKVTAEKPAEETTEKSDA